MEPCVDDLGVSSVDSRKGVRRSLVAGFGGQVGGFEPDFCNGINFHGLLIV